MPSSRVSSQTSRSSRSSRSVKTSRRRSPRSTTSSTQGFDAVIVNANNPAAFGAVVKKANDAGVVLLSFDNVIDDPMNIQSTSTRRAWAPPAIPAQAAQGRRGKFLDVRGPAGQPVDMDRHDGFHEALANPATSGTSPKSSATGHRATHRR